MKVLQGEIYSRSKAKIQLKNVKKKILQYSAVIASGEKDEILLLKAKVGLHKSQKRLEQLENGEKLEENSSE